MKKNDLVHGILNLKRKLIMDTDIKNLGEEFLNLCIINLVSSN